MLDILLGDMVTMALEGRFEVIGHGCNCFCRMKRGIAPQMDAAFGCNHPELFTMENPYYAGDIRKLGQLQTRSHSLASGSVLVANLYSQYHWHDPGPHGIPLDYEALRLCLRKLGHLYPEKHVALPGIIGCGLAGGQPDLVVEMIQKELAHSHVSLVFLDKSKIPPFLN